MNNSELAAMNKATPASEMHLIFKAGFSDIKFTKPYPLAHGADDSKQESVDIGRIRVVQMGDMSTNEDCTRILNYFFRSISGYVDRPPCVADFNIKISGIHNTRVKPSYRLIFFAFGVYCKLNVQILPHDIHTRAELTKNNRDKWLDKRQLSLKLLNRLFYQDSEGAEKKFMRLSLNGGKEILQFLRKNKALTTRNCWFLNSMEAVSNENYEESGWACLNTRWGVWRAPNAKRQENSSDVWKYEHQWMFNLINTIRPNECLLTIKVLQLVATRITSLLYCDNELTEQQDGLFFVDLILLMLNIDLKGDINTWHQSLMSIKMEDIRLCADRNVDKCLNILNYTTVQIGECLRTLSKLSDFDFKWVLRNKYVHQMWLTYLYAVLISLIDYIRLFETGLGDLSNYLQYSPQQEILCM